MSSCGHNHSVISMISVTILTKNSEKYIGQVVEALKRFDEVLLYDNGSSDATIEIAAKFPNVTVVKGPFLGFGATHNRASGLARNEWILSIDSDEIVRPTLADEILSLRLDPKAVYSIQRDNYYRDKEIKWCGWHPDRQYRLYHRRETQFTDAKVHEQVIVEGMRHIPLKNSMIHYSYSSIAEFLDKMQSYSELFAEQNCGVKNSSPLKAISHGLFAFIKSYLLKRGFMGGYEGFLISTYNAETAFYKYLKLYEKNGRLRRKDKIQR